MQEQMEQFFYELEDDQMFILQNFVSAVWRNMSFEEYALCARYSTQKMWVINPALQIVWVMRNQTGT